MTLELNGVQTQFQKQYALVANTTLKKADKTTHETDQVAGSPFPNAKNT